MPAYEIALMGLEYFGLCVFIAYYSQARGSHQFIWQAGRKDLP